MLTDAELALGGYRFEDLQELRIVENRTDLARKQTEHGFPKAVKTGKKQTLFLKAEVHAWLRKRAALRDAPAPAEPPALPAPVVKCKPPRRDAPVENAPSQARPPARRAVGRPRKVRQ